MEEQTDIRIKSLRLLPPLQKKKAYKVFLQLYKKGNLWKEKKKKVRNVLPLFIPFTSLLRSFDLVVCGDSS